MIVSIKICGPIVGHRIFLVSLRKRPGREKSDLTKEKITSISKTQHNYFLRCQTVTPWVSWHADYELYESKASCIFIWPFLKSLFTLLWSPKKLQEGVTNRRACQPSNWQSQNRKRKAHTHKEKRIRQEKGKKNENLAPSYSA